MYMETDKNYSRELYQPFCRSYVTKKLLVLNIIFFVVFVILSKYNGHFVFF